jgi:hypothetical protein
MEAGDRMTVTLNWKRVGKGSGPGNVLNGRYEVVGNGQGPWEVRDLHDHHAVVNRSSTMRGARRQAETLAAIDAHDHQWGPWHGFVRGGIGREERACECGAVQSRADA